MIIYDEASTLTSEKVAYIMARKTKSSKRKPPFPALWAALRDSVSVLALEAAGALKLAPVDPIARKTGVVYDTKRGRHVVDFESGSFV